MSKEIEQLKNEIEEAYKQLWHEREYAYDSKVCSKGKGWTETIQHYDNIGRNLLEVKRILDDLITEYEAIKNANPSEALECLEKIRRSYDETTTGMYGLGEVVVGNELEQYYSKELDTIKQALLKAQEPKQYLKWEDLEFTNEVKEMKVKLGDNTYEIEYYICNALGLHQPVVILKTSDFIAITIEQFFNDLRLERVKE